MVLGMELIGLLLCVLVLGAIIPSPISHFGEIRSKYRRVDGPSLALDIP